MLRQLKTVLILGALLGGFQSSWAFSLLGPIHEAEPWQVPELGYNPLGDGQSFFPYTGDGREDPAMGVRNIGQEYRRNIPILYYNFNLNFRDYFGARGVQEADKAFTILNSLTSVSSYSPELTEFPTDSRRDHLQAAILGLADLKSEVLHLMMEQIGLAPPERYVWALHQRVEFDPGPCPDTMGYLLVRRNFDPVTSQLNQFQNSSYVNGTLYSFFIFDDCGDEGPPDADAMEFPVDPLASTYTAVANPLALGPGRYLTDLTRDDVGGMRYLIRSNNINFESPGNSVEAFITNAISPVPIITQDLGLLIAQARTNDAAALQALFPGLVTTATLTGFGLVTNVVTTFSISAPAWSPAGVFVITPVTNQTVSFVPLYQHTFANVVTNTFSTRSIVQIQTTMLTNVPFSPGGLLALQTTSVLYSTNLPSGDFFIIPEGLCGVTILSNILSTPVFSISTVTATNGLGETNVNGGFFEQSTITVFTNQALAFLPITCETNAPAQYQGIERIRYIHPNDDHVDPLTGQYFTPFTSEYTLNQFNPTNAAIVPIRVRRLVTQPDFLFSARDLSDEPDGDNGFVNLFNIAVSVPFNTDNVLPGLAGPGTIDSTLLNTFVEFNNGGPFYIGFSPDVQFMDLAEASLFPLLTWGSFDGTTNAPVVYPNGTSIEQFEYLRLLRISPTPPNLPPGRVGTAYSQVVTVANGQGPFTFAMAPGTPGGLPQGLTLAPDGTISGTPTTPGTYDVAIRLTDAVGRFLDVAYAIVIQP